MVDHFVFAAGRHRLREIGLKARRPYGTGNMVGTGIYVPIGAIAGYAVLSHPQPMPSISVRDSGPHSNKYARVQFAEGVGH